MRSLPPDQQAVLSLRYLDDLSVPEVADVLGRSVHATESLLARARRAFRKSYEGQSDG
jgi:RNA polymerase sigma-70 factor (ECF subfamily)